MSYYKDGRAVDYSYRAAMEIDFDSDKCLDGFKMNQDLVSLFDKIFTQALEQSIDQLKLIVNNEEELANVDVKVRIYNSDCSELP